MIYIYIILQEVLIVFIISHKYHEQINVLNKRDNYYYYNNQSYPNNISMRFKENCNN